MPDDMGDQPHLSTTAFCSLGSFPPYSFNLVFCVSVQIVLVSQNYNLLEKIVILYVLRLIYLLQSIILNYNLKLYLIYIIWFATFLHLFIGDAHDHLTTHFEVSNSILFEQIQYMLEIINL